jgi:hypothetical protein
MVQAARLLLRIYLWIRYLIPLVPDAYVAVAPHALHYIRVGHHHTVAGGSHDGCLMCL